MNDPWEKISAVVRAMSTADDTTDSMDAAVTGALELIPRAHHVGVTMVRKGRQPETVAASDDSVRQADLLQHELGEGPLLQSLVQEETVHSGDLTREERWTTWSRRAAYDLDLRSLLCLQLFVAKDAIGALSIYSADVDAFDDGDRTTALALAAHVAAALTSAYEIENLEAAIVNRTVIGQAQGMLMERYAMSAAAAFNVLKRFSQQQNKPLHAVARELVELGIQQGMDDQESDSERTTA
jgi:GAF domain-containing protein